MGLYDVYCFVKQDFKESCCPAQVFYGKEHVAENADPVANSNAIGGRVVIYPTNDGAYEAPLASQGAGIPVPSMSGGQNPKSIMRRIVGAEIAIWAAAQLQKDGIQQLPADTFALDALINQTALSLYRGLTLGPLEILGGQNRNEPMHERRGLSYLMRIQVEVPIVDIDFPCARIDTNVFTWLTETATPDVTVEMRQGLPTGPLMDSVHIVPSSS